MILEKSRKRVFDPESSQNDPLGTSNFDLEPLYYVPISTFKVENTLQVELLLSKIISKELLNNSKTTFKTSKKSNFVSPKKWSKWPSQREKMTKISIFAVIYQPFELKIH